MATRDFTYHLNFFSVSAKKNGLLWRWKCSRVQDFTLNIPQPASITL